MTLTEVVDEIGSIVWCLNTEGKRYALHGRQVINDKFRKTPHHPTHLTS